ncbi:MAG TPA: TraR/DksA C4-type zinc finger protein [Verrucomicrobiae bacterium]|nr:TraR/DksA C4-type zinc finger protein [Verrucomicrobiae bacterium]
MNANLVEENKAKLMAEEKRLRGILGHEGKLEGKGEFPGEYKPNFTEAGREEGENASEVEQYANDLGVTVDLEEKLTKVEAALKRIEDGTYGKCAMGDEIEEDRLRALPEADTCIKHSA